MPEQEITAEQIPAKTPAGTPDFAKVSEEYWQKDAEQKARAVNSKKDTSFAVITPPSTDPLLDAFSAAFDTPVIMPVEWPEDVPEGHPIRQLPVHVRLWNGPQWAKFWELNKEVKNTDGAVDDKASLEMLKKQFWYVLIISACDNFGRPLFEKFMGDTPDCFCENGLQAMKDRFDGPGGLLTMNPIHIAALGFNGLLRGNEERDGKNSDGTSDSTSSGE